VRTIRAFVGDVLSRGPFGRIRVPPGLLVIVGVGLVTVLAIAQIAMRHRRDLSPANPADAARATTPSDGARAILVNVGLVGSAVVAFFATVAIQQALNPPRYDYIAVTLICAASVFGAALVGRGAADVGDTAMAARRFVILASRLALPIIVIVLAVGWGRSFSVENRASSGPDVVAEFDASGPACRTGQGSIKLPISPAGRGWTVEIPCDRVLGR